ncbi:MAG: hypothetical protein KDD10_30595 [Phaeodactylibacter sp.]|nr:hypothetical protein [Phaeodactylibacter sp.]
MDKVAAAQRLQVELERVAESYGARAGVPDSVLSECTQLVFSKFPGLGIGEIREAYRMKAAGQLDVPKGKGEMWGGVFNADQLGAVLSAYMKSRRRALGAYLRLVEGEKRSQEQVERSARMQAEFDAQFPALIEKMKTEAKDWRDCPFWLFESAWKRGLISLEPGEKESILEDAMQLARIEAENAYAEAQEAGGLGVFRMRELRKAMDDEKGIEARAKTIARQITLFRKLC